MIDDPSCCLVAKFSYRSLNGAFLMWHVAGRLSDNGCCILILQFINTWLLLSNKTGKLCWCLTAFLQHILTSESILTAYFDVRRHSYSMFWCKTASLQHILMSDSILTAYFDVRRHSYSIFWHQTAFLQHILT